jgi:hypothetical protein
MSGGFERLENQQPQEVTEQVRRITQLLNQVDGLTFSITQNGLCSIIKIHEEIPFSLLPEIQALALSDKATLVAVERIEHTITVSLQPNKLN